MRKTSTIQLGLIAQSLPSRKREACRRTARARDICLQITLGRLQYRRGRADLALLTLTQAYRASLTLAAAEPRVVAAAALSPVMRVVGDFAQALALNQEVDRLADAAPRQIEPVRSALPARPDPE